MEVLWAPTLRVMALGKCRSGFSFVVVMKMLGLGQIAFLFS